MTISWILYKKKKKKKKKTSKQSNSNVQKLLSSRYGTFDSENGDSDQRSCNLVVKGLSGDVSGNFQLDFDFTPRLRCSASHVGASDEPVEWADRVITEQTKNSLAVS